MSDDSGDYESDSDRQVHRPLQNQSDMVSDSYNESRVKNKRRAPGGKNQPYSPSTNNDIMSQSQGKSSMYTHNQKRFGKSGRSGGRNRADSYDSESDGTVLPPGERSSLIQG